MSSSRRPRFARASNLVPIELTERDREIVRLVHRHRFLRSSHICSLIAGSYQQILRRLQLLFHHGYLERPRAQLEYYHRGGSREIVYGLGKRSAEIVNIAPRETIHEFDWGKKNRAIQRIFLEHALLVSDIMVSLTLACQENGVRLLMEADLAGNGRRFRWKVDTHGTTLGVVPDRVFALKFTGIDGNPTRAFFFLEADRGTVPVTRKNLVQTSFRRKLLAYEATWAQSIHAKRFSFHRFRVLTVTTTALRVQSLVNACADLASGRGLFLFADKSILENPANLFSRSWRTGKGGESSGILD